MIAVQTAKDSKAMKTLALITIVFLPGTFVATMFATNMIKFRRGQMGWIYAVVVVPITTLLVVSWLVWYRKKSRVPYTRTLEDDEEEEVT